MSTASESAASRPLTGSSMVPMLEKGDFLKWQMCVKAYLTPYDHVRVIEPIRTATGTLIEPKASIDPKALAEWA